MIWTVPELLLSYVTPRSIVMSYMHEHSIIML